MKNRRKVVIFTLIAAAGIICASALILFREKSPIDSAKVATEVRNEKTKEANESAKDTQIIRSFVGSEITKETAKSGKSNVEDINAIKDVEKETSMPGKPELADSNSANNNDITGELCQELKTSIINKDSNETEELLDEIVEQGDESVYHLKSLLLESNEPDVKEFAAIGLARINSPKSVNELIDGVRKTQDENIRENLIKTFNEIKDAASADELLETLTEEETGILRDGVRDTLGRVADSKVVENMVKLYGEFDGQDKGLEQINLLATLLRVRSEESVPALKDIIVKGKTTSLSTNAALSLGAIGSESAIKAIALAITDEDMTGNELTCAHAMASIKNENATSMLSSYLSNDNEDLRMGAALALGNTNSKKVLAILEQASQFEQSEKVKTAIESSKAKITAVLAMKSTK